MCQTTRRGFLVGCSAAIASLAGSRFNSFAFASPRDGYNDEVLIVLFLRGGQDGLNLVVPTGGASNDRAYYEQARPNLLVPAGQALDLGSLGSTSFGFHPAASPLHDLYTNGNLAVAVACGMAVNDRSHFDSMNWIELGTPGDSGTTDGWLTRHFLSAQNLPPEIILPSLSVGGTQAMSLLASYDTLNLESVDTFNLDVGPWNWQSAQRLSLRHLYSNDQTFVHQTGLHALDAVDIVELYATGDYIPAGGAVYPDTYFGDNLKTIARMIKLGLGLRAATLDLGGWDTHSGQGDGGGGYYAQLVAELAQGLNALWTDLDAAPGYTSKLTLLVMSEFGRRLWENGDQGTDHGHGNNMLILSGSAIPGLHGTWPGLAPGQLSDGDVNVTNEMRRILSEILVRRMGNPAIDYIFPGYTGYSPLGVVQGQDVNNTIFDDGFETGDTSAWSATTG